MVTPRLEVILKRAAAIANDRGYNDMVIEHVALAILDDRKCVPAACWTGPMTAKQGQNAIVEALPDVPEVALAPTMQRVVRIADLTPQCEGQRQQPYPGVDR